MLTSAVIATVFLLIALLLAVGWIQHAREQRRLRQVRALSAAHAQILRVEQIEHALPPALRSRRIARLLMMYLEARLESALVIDPLNPYLQKHAERVAQRLLDEQGDEEDLLPERLKVNGLTQEKAQAILQALQEVRTLCAGMAATERFPEADRRAIARMVEFGRAAVPLELLLQQAAMYETVSNLAASLKLLHRARDLISESRCEDALGTYERVVRERALRVAEDHERQLAEARREAQEKSDDETPDDGNVLAAALDRQLRNAGN